MKYLVTGSGGPGFASAGEALAVLEQGTLPPFDALRSLEADKKVVAGGLPVEGRAFTFIAEAASDEELVRDLPAWGVLGWQVTPLQTFAGRAAHECEFVKRFKKVQ